MTNREDFRLTGGVFFALFFHACKDLSEQKSFAIKDANKGPIPTVMDELLYVMTGKHEKRAAQAQQTFKDNVNKYRFCKVNSRAHIKIGKTDAISVAFDQLVKDNYDVILSRMREVVDGYLHVTPEIDKNLIKALMELISLDKEMKSLSLYVSGTDPVSVEEVPKLTVIDMAAFLVGVWHYCVCVVDNEEGKDTINVLCPERSGKPRDYIGDLGINITSNISFEELKIESSVGIEDNEPETIEAEIIDAVEVEEERKREHEEKESPRPASQMMFNFNVTGNNNSFYNHVDTVNNYYGGKKDGQ
ncbi:MAG: hypothetical protein HUJ72_11730 [Blautia sp.]|nr:hypothetical protein [Blautia sp.]